MSKDSTSQALMLRDTIVRLQGHLAEVSGDGPFHDGYRLGLEHAIETLLAQCEVFGVAKDLYLA